MFTCACSYDLQKSFDSVEYPVLLEKLFDAGVNGKMWRSLKNLFLSSEVGRQALE